DASAARRAQIFDAWRRRLRNGDVAIAAIEAIETILRVEPKHCGPRLPTNNARADHPIIARRLEVMNRARRAVFSRRFSQRHIVSVRGVRNFLERDRSDLTLRLTQAMISLNVETHQANDGANAEEQRAAEHAASAFERPPAEHPAEARERDR